MYKNNEITDDDTAHKSDALKKDVFFLCFMHCTTIQSVGIKTWKLVYFD